MKSKDAFLFLYSPNKYMAKKYPKAAKKRRIQKKWLNRFGPDFDFKAILYRPNPFLEMIEKQELSGVYLPMPVNYSYNA